MSFKPKPQLDPDSLVVPHGTGEAVVKGVRISCGGAREALKEKTYIPVEVYKDGHSLLKNTDIGHPVSAISQRIGMPVYVCRYGPDPAYPSSNEGGNHMNPEALFLMRQVNPEDEGFGFAPAEWQLSVHDCLVTRVDGEGITPNQVEALCHFSQHHLDGAFLDVMRERMERFDDDGRKKEKAKVLDFITPEKFREFFLEFKTMKMKEDVEDVDWVNATCPV